MRSLLFVVAFSLLLLGLTGCPSDPPPPPSPVAGETPSAPPELPPYVADATGSWSCPMHSEVRAAQKSRCPECNMFLVEDE